MSAFGMISRIALEEAARNAAKNQWRKARKSGAFERDMWLHRVGLTSYSPTREAVRGVSLFLAGAAIGGILGLLFAPKSGEEFRSDLAERSRMRTGTERELHS